MTKYNVLNGLDNTDSKSYTCPHCGAFAGMEKYSVYLVYMVDRYVLMPEQNLEEEIMKLNNKFDVITCRACGKVQFWLGEKMIYPASSGIEEPNEDMPEEVKNLYNEARSVFEFSPKAGAALLRLGLQNLCKYLGGKGENINKDIGWLVKQGLPIEIQKAMDSIRVIGNNGVHPGEINLDENKDLAEALFPLMNLIVEKMISEPKKIAKIYKMLPEGAVKAVEKRDKE